MKAEKNAFMTSIGAARIATKAHKTSDGGIIVASQRSGHPLILDLYIHKLRPEVPAFSFNRTSKGTTQRDSGIGLFVSYQTSTGFRQCGCRLLLVKPEAIDPGHRSMPGKNSTPLDSEVEDAYLTASNQGHNIDNNDSCLMGKYESLQSDLHSLALYRRIETRVLHRRNLPSKPTALHRDDVPSK